MVYSLPLLAATLLTPGESRAMMPAPGPGVSAPSPGWLLTHPAALAPAMTALAHWRSQPRAQTLIRQALADQAALLHDPDTPVLHEDGAVSLVLFQDYQCLFCAKAAPLLEQVVVTAPEVRMVFKEWPVLSGRWPVSLTAARTGLAVWRRQGPDAWWRYHNAVFATGHDEGALTEADLQQVLRVLHTDLRVSDPEAGDPALRATAELATRLGLHGTPAFVIMPTRGATAETTTVLPGMPDPATLMAAVRLALGDGEPAGR